TERPHGRSARGLPETFRPVREPDAPRDVKPRKPGKAVSKERRRATPCEYHPRKTSPADLGGSLTPQTPPQRPARARAGRKEKSDGRGQGGRLRPRRGAGGESTGRLRCGLVRRGHG